MEYHEEETIEWLGTTKPDTLISKKNMMKSLVVDSKHIELGMKTCRKARARSDMS